MPRPVRLAYLATHPMTAAHLMKGQLRHMRKRGFEVLVITGPGAELERVREQEGVEVATVPMEREISPFADLLSLFRLYSTLRRFRPHIVNAGTPKAGLLGCLAAAFLRVPVRVYTLRGLRLETTHGMKRRLLTLTERLAAACAHRILCVSHSLRGRALELRLAAPERMTVLADGSSNGVDIQRFDAASGDEEHARKLRRQLDLPPESPVIGFVGRLTHDKGAAEALTAFERLRGRWPELRLLVLGEPESGDPMSREAWDVLRDQPGIIRTGFVPETAPYYPLMDVLVFPSHREGFPNVPLEAAAAAVPCVGCRVTGTVDAIVDGETGALVERGDPTALAEALAVYLDNPALAREHGLTARERAAHLYPSIRVWEALEDEYRRLLEQRVGDA